MIGHQLSVRFAVVTRVRILLVAALLGVCASAVSGQGLSDRNVDYCLRLGSDNILCNSSALTPSQRITADATAHRINLDYCLRLGSDNILCKPSRLTAEERGQADASARRINDDYCQRLGSDNILCKPSLLSPDERVQADASSRRINRDYCARLGSDNILCKPSLLTADERAEAVATTRRINRDNCLRLGSNSILCKAELLTPDERAAADAPGQRTSPQSASGESTSGSAAPACEENGSCYGDTSDATGRPKTVDVHGYTRKDGTYVRGHYRSAPSKGSSRGGRK
jgi:hypothetical protein